MPAHPDPTFHASAKLAMQAPPEKLAYTVMLSPDFSQPDALAVVDLDPGSKSLGKIVHTVTMPNKGDEFHHFGWNACSSALSPLAGHAFLERRYLIIPGIRSSRIYVIDTKPDPTKAKIHKIIEPEEVFAKTGYSRPHTIHCGPEGIYVSTLGGGGADGTNGPPGIFIMDCETFEVIGRYELDRGLQDKHYDFWWNLPRDYMVSSEWGLPPQFENGVVPADLVSNKYGHRLHFWNLRERRNVQTIDLGANHHDIDLSLDDRFLYVSCWGTGELRQYDVSDPMKPTLSGSVHIGGVTRKTPHPGADYRGGPQMVEISRDGKRVYWTNSLYSTWDNQFYPDGVPGAMAKADVGDNGGITLENTFYVEFPAGYRSHQIRLEGGDCSTDSFCYPSV